MEMYTSGRASNPTLPMPVGIAVGIALHEPTRGTFVDFEHSLNAAVKRLRAALGDDAREPRYIETLPRRGYRWIAAALPAREAELPRRRPGRIEILWA
jgi:Transcriptional regulatory protein, C terminal